MLKLLKRYRYLSLAVLALVIILTGVAGGVHKLWPAGENPRQLANQQQKQADTAPGQDTHGKDNEKIYLLELKQPLSDAIAHQLKQKYHWCGDTYHGAVLIRGAARQEQALANLPFVRQIKELAPAQKIAPELQNQNTAPGQSAMMENVLICLYQAQDKEGVVELISQLGGQPALDSQEETGRYLQARIPIQALAQLSAAPQVLFVEKNHQAQLLNDRARDIIGARPAAAADLMAPQGLKGQNQTIGLADSGLDKGTISDLHPDFHTPSGHKPQIIMLKSWCGDDPPADTVGHGTHMAGTLVGSGQASDGKYTGLAPEASLYVQGIVNAQGQPTLPTNLDSLYRPAYEANVRVHVNGWGRKTNNYTGSSAQIDDFVRRSPDFLPVFGAGNFGPGPGTVTAEANSKNALVVGATASSRPALQGENNHIGPAADFSSRGPAADGRIKPELLAPGTAIISTASRLAPDSENLSGSPYTMLQGTSMATAVAGGAATLVRQYLAQQKGLTDPSAALLKALLINGADMPQDQTQGFGLLNITRTIVSLQDKLIHIDDYTQGVQDKEHVSYQYVVDDDAAPFKATLAWTDPPGLPGATQALVNNLDLVVITPQGKRYHGNQHLYPQGPDQINNVEQIHIPHPSPGVYTIRVEGKNVLQSANGSSDKIAQDFALVYGQPALSAEVMDFDPRRRTLTLDSGQDYALGNKNFYSLTNDHLTANDSQHIQPGSQLYVGQDALYFVTRTWREFGLRLQKAPGGWLWTKNSYPLLDDRSQQPDGPASWTDSDGGYYSQTDQPNIKINGVLKEDLAPVPAGFEALAVINPLKQIIRRADIAYTSVNGFIQAFNQDQSTLRLLGDSQTYRLAADVTYGYQDQLWPADPLQGVFGAATPEPREQNGLIAREGLPVSLMVAPTARQVQSIAINRIVAVGSVDEVDVEKSNIVLQGKKYRIMPGAVITQDNQPAELDKIKPGALATLVLIDEKGDVVSLSAYTKHLMGQISHLQSRGQTIYLTTDNGIMFSLQCTPSTKIYSQGQPSDFNALGNAMWVRVILAPQGQQVWRIDTAESLEETNKAIDHITADSGELVTKDGITFTLGPSSRVYLDGFPLPPTELARAGHVQRVVSLLDKGPKNRVVVRLEATAKPNQGTPELRVSSIPFAADYWVAGETTAPKLYLSSGAGDFEPVHLSPEGRFSLGYVPRENQQYLYLTAVSDQHGVAGAKLSITAPKQKSFTDIAGHWAETDLKAMAREGLISGHPDGTYGPDAAVSRVEFYALLARAFGWYADLDQEQPFSDWHLVPRWARQVVGGAVQQQIVAGYPDNTFEPLKPVTRVEQSAVLARVMAKHWLDTKNDVKAPLDFADSDTIPDWARASVGKVVAEGIMQGQDKHLFAPYALATRAETAVSLYRLLEKVRDYRPAAEE